MAQSSSAPATRAQRAPSANPRGPRYNKRLAPITNEQASLLKELVAMSPKERAVTILTPTQVAAIVGRGAKTMERDRALQRKAIKDNQPIDGASPSSLPYAPPSAADKEVRYFASDVLDYINRVYDKVDRSFLRAVRGDDPAMRGFQSWLSLAGPGDRWTFCVQPDGRPLDLGEALATDRLTDDTVALTLLEFSSRMADAARRASANSEAAALARAANKAVHPGKPFRPL